MTAVIKVFITGPSDTASDVEVVKQCIDDINLIANPLGLMFQPFYWGTDAVPGMGIEPQEVINEQAEGYDAIISIFAAKIGTPTKTHTSGTIEEIESAIENAQSLTFGKHSIMIFFRGVKLDSRHSDLAAALKLQEFRNSLGEKGILYKDFDTEIDLRAATFRSFGVLIAKRTQDSPRRSVSIIENTLHTATEAKAELEEEEELGLLDFEKMSSEKMDEATAYATRVAESIVALGERVNAASEDIKVANSVGDRAEVRRIVNVIASEMGGCAKELNLAAPALYESFRTAFEAVQSVLDLQESDFTDVSPDGRQSFFDTTVRISDTIKNTIENISGFHEEVAKLPRMTKELNQAKRELLAATETLLAKLEAILSENQSFLARQSHILLPASTLER